MHKKTASPLHAPARAAAVGRRHHPSREFSFEKALCALLSNTAPGQFASIRRRRRKWGDSMAPCRGHRSLHAAILGPGHGALLGPQPNYQQLRAMPTTKGLPYARNSS